MQNLPDISSKAWVALLWSQYNKLSKPLRDSFFGLTLQIAEEADKQNPNRITYGHSEKNMEENNA